MQKRAKKGFTLIELLIVIAIIGLLATLAIVSLTTAQRKARDTKRIADVKQLQNAVELYYSEFAAYPLTTAAANNTWAAFGTTIGSYITNVPIDPTNTGTDVYTYGAIATEYFIGADLEDTSHDALDGDDDVAYTTTTPSAAWGALDTVESNDTTGGTGEQLTAYNCGTGTDLTDDDVGIYCVSE